MNKFENIAIVRGIPNTFSKSITSFHTFQAINVNLAKQQHNAYCHTLKQLGLKLIYINADDTLPDCCFVEDQAIVLDDIAIITYTGAPIRLTERIDVEKSLAPLKKLYHITPPATIDGGDVLKIDKKIFIGKSARTNMQGIEQVAAIIRSKGVEVIPVSIWNTLHLKSVCTYLGHGCILLAEGYFDKNIFSEYDKIVVPKEEEYCANCLVVDSKVLIPKGFPTTKSLIEAKGFSVIEIEMSEIEKAEGALTCLSVIC